MYEYARKVLHDIIQFLRFTFVPPVPICTPVSERLSGQNWLDPAHAPANRLGAGMKVYRICSLDGDGKVLHCFKLACRDDENALEEGLSICANNEIEIWEGERLVVRLSAGVPSNISEDCPGPSSKID